jgi:hypothetical protein
MPPVRPLPVIPRGFRIRTLGNNTAVGTVSQNRFLFLANPLSIALPTALAVAGAFGAYWNAFVSATMSVDYVGAQIGCIDLSTSTSTEVFASHAFAGGLAAPAAAPNLCANVKHSTGVRHKIGKTYLSPLAEASLLPSKTALDGTFRTIMDSAFQDLINHFSADGVWGTNPPIYCVLSQQTAGVIVGSAPPILSSVVETNLASQRPRRGY